MNNQPSKTNPKQTQSKPIYGELASGELVEPACTEQGRSVESICNYLFKISLCQSGGTDDAGVFAEGGETNLDRFLLQIPNVLIEEIFYPA